MSLDNFFITISATTSNPDVSAAICNCLADVSDNCIFYVAPKGTVNVIHRAVPANVSINSIEIIKLPVMAFVLSCLLFICIDIFTISVKDTDELVRIFSTPVLAKLRTKGLSGKNLSALITKSVSFDVLESYKTIRTELFYPMDNHTGQLLTVSGISSDSNPVIAANIALSLAQTNKKILLMDADLRKPEQHKLFNVENQKGLSSILCGTSDERSSIIYNVSDNLDLLPSGIISDNPSDILSSDSFEKLLENLSSSYDYIIIAAPCLNDVGDALIPGRLAGNILLTIKYSRTKYKDIAEAFNKIKALNISIPGFIVDGITDYGKLKFLKSI